MSMKISSICLVLTLTSVQAFAITRTLTPIRDNTVYEVSAAANALSNGAGTRIFAGRTAQGTNSIRRALIAFDPAGAAIPNGAVITGAALSLEMNMTNAGSEAVSIHRVLAPWGEGGSSASGGQGGGAPAQTGDATWFHTFFSSSFWGSPGGDFSGAPSATQNVAGNGSYTWGSTTQMVADVQSWVDNPSSNHGWLVMGNEASAPTAKSFDSRESGNGPVLVVTFNAAVPTTNRWALLLFALLLASFGVLSLRWVSIRR